MRARARSVFPPGIENRSKADGAVLSQVEIDAVADLTHDQIGRLIGTRLGEGIRAPVIRALLMASSEERLFDAS